MNKMSAETATEIVPPVPETASVYKRVYGALNKGKKPKLCVFDLDYTIWACDCDKDIIEPYVEHSTSGINTVFDRHGRLVILYSDVREILGAIADSEIPVAFLSRNPSRGSIEKLLKVLRCPSEFTESKTRTVWKIMPDENYLHAYSNGGFGKGKDLHFKNLQAVCSIPFSEMIFFDDMYDNVKAASIQGTTSVQLHKTGLTEEAFLEGIKCWQGRATAE